MVSADQATSFNIAFLLVFSIAGANAQFSFDVQTGIDIGLQVGVSIGICIVTIGSLVAIINFLKFKVLRKPKNAEPAIAR